MVLTDSSWSFAVRVLVVTGGCDWGQEWRRGQGLGEEDVQEYGCFALQNILSYNSTEMATRAGNAGAIEALVAAMRGHARSEIVQELGCNALFDLSIGSTENATRAVNAGAVEAMVAAMRGHAGSQGVQEQACVALYHLIALNYPENIKRALRAGAKKLAKAAMTAHSGNSEVTKGARDLLERLSYR
mmetsp:Transcript_20615/g.33427  ORF Transcript_20615/g.33427 Transcript_20615/m.33427 type:complete len:187 (-) Transcript_20615:402-962(-)